MQYCFMVFGVSRSPLVPSNPVQSPQPKSAPIGAREKPPIASWIWVGILAIIVAAFRFTPRRENALDIGEHALTWFFVFGPFVAFAIVAVPITLIERAIRAVVRLRRKKVYRWVPCAQILLLLAALSTLAIKPNKFGTNPISAADEAQYLKFAEKAREWLTGDKKLFEIKLEKETWDSDAPEEAVARAELLGLLPAYWPKKYSYVWLDRNCVVIQRGGSLSGRVGVRIYDQGPVQLHTPEELRQNPYLPDQTRITDRLYYFTSD